MLNFRKKALKFTPCCCIQPISLFKGYVYFKIQFHQIDYHLPSQCTRTIYIFKHVLLVGIAELGRWQACRAVRISHLAELKRVRRSSPRRAGSAQIPKRLVQKGMKRARSPAGGAGEDAGPCRAVPGSSLRAAGLLQQPGLCLYIAGAAASLPPSLLPPSRPAGLRQGRAGRSLRRGAAAAVRTRMVLGEIKSYWKKK